MKALQLTISILIFTSFTFGQLNSWNGITPLQSNRTDVERLLGKPKECKYGSCLYETEKEKVNFTYIENKCQGGWDVPKDTVSSIFVEQKDLIGKSYEELNLDESKFIILSVNDVLSKEWLNAEEGISYHFDNPLVFTGKSYHPKKSDNNLRCNGFPPYAPEEGYYFYSSVAVYDPKDNSRDVFYRAIMYFDNEILSARTTKGAKAYILVYFDNKLSLKEYRNRVNRIKDFLIKKRHYLPKEINIVEGGLRERSAFEFYQILEGEKPPTPTLTLPSPQFMRKQ